jgi:hypothetical protein
MELLQTSLMEICISFWYIYFFNSNKDIFSILNVTRYGMDIQFTKSTWTWSMYNFAHLNVWSSKILFIRN